MEDGAFGEDDSEEVDAPSNVIRKESSTGDELEAVIHAIAPKVHSEAEEQVDLTVSPAFLCLDQLFVDGKISGEKVSRLKNKYQELLQLLRTTRETESEYLHQGKDHMQKLVQQRSLLEKGDLFPSGEDTEVNRLRVEYLKYQNKLAASDERLYQLTFKLDSLQEEKRLLTNEYVRIPKKEDIDKQIRDYTTEIDELKVDIAQRSHEGGSLQEELQARREEMKVFLKGNDDFDREELILKDEMVKIYQEPIQIAKSIEMETKKFTELKDKQSALMAEIEGRNKDVQNCSDRKSMLMDEKDQLSKALDQQRAIFEEKEKEVDLLMKECDLAKERQAELLGDRTSFDMKMKHVTLDKKAEHDIHARKTREKERDLKNLKKAELQANVGQDALSHTTFIYDKIKMQVDAEKSKDDGSLLEKRKELQKEVDIAKRAYGQQNSLTAHEKQRVEQGIHEEERLLLEQGQLRVDLVDLTRLVQIKADEREQKARDYLKAELRHHKAIEDLKTKHLAIQDSAKKYSEVQRRLEDFAKLYDVIKNERNKCVNLIQTSTQRAAEMREKIKILQNEIEILRTAAGAKERTLAKSKLKHSNAVVIRDSLRNELSKHRLTAEDLKEQIEQQRLGITKLNDMINKAEEAMVELRRRYENSIQDRNRRGILLIERNEEVCVLYEKLNVQGSMIRNGDIELQSRVEEIRFLKMEVADLKRSLDLLHGTLPNKRSLDNDLSTLQIQLLQCQEYERDLELKLEDPTNKERVRLLDGEDPHPGELQKKLEQLGKLLAAKEEKLLEKDLIHEQVNKLVARSKKMTSHGQGDTLQLAKKINGVQCKIKDTTRSIMAIISELSMNQAKALQMQQESREKEGLVEQCYIRMERGEAPSQEIEQEWIRYLKKEINKCRTMDQRERAEEDIAHYTIAGGTTTTAEPRPNAYIPDDDTELPLPRPYGGNAPFKPSDPGANMRHIRKPVQKEIIL